MLFVMEYHSGQQVVCSFNIEEIALVRIPEVFTRIDDEKEDSSSSSSSLAKQAFCRRISSCSYVRLCLIVDEVL